jgi:hypothetical protein
MLIGYSKGIIGAARKCCVSGTEKVTPVIRVVFPGDRQFDTLQSHLRLLYAPSSLL